MPRMVVPLLPPERSYSSTCSRTHWVGLGSYSPEKGHAPSQHHGAGTPHEGAAEMAAARCAGW